MVKQEQQPDLDEAEQCCRRALELEPSFYWAFGCLGLIAFKRGRLREAEDHFRSSIVADEKLGSYADLGALYVLMGRHADAKQALQVAIQMNKDDPQPHLELANLYLQTGKKKEAIYECRRATAIAPDSVSAARALAVALIHVEDYGEAEKVLREALRKQDESKRWQLHLTLSQLLTRLGDKTSEVVLYEEALKEVKTAIRLKPNSPELLFHKGILRSRCKDPRGALKDFEMCNHLDEHHFEAERYANLVRKQIRADIHRGSQVASWTVVVIATLLLAVLWFKYFYPGESPPQHQLNVATTSSELASKTIATALAKVGILPRGTVQTSSTPASESKLYGGSSMPTTTPLQADRTDSKTNDSTRRVTDTMLTVMTPLLLGMIIVGFLLPTLIRLKFAGIEAELTQPKEVISTGGPKGEVSLGGSLSTINP